MKPVGYQPGRIQPVSVGGRYNAAVTKQWMSKWPYIANAVYQIVQNLGEKGYFRRF